MTVQASLSRDTHGFKARGTHETKGNPNLEHAYRGLSLTKVHNGPCLPSPEQQINTQTGTKNTKRSLNMN